MVPHELLMACLLCTMRDDVEMIEMLRWVHLHPWVHSVKVHLGAASSCWGSISAQSHSAEDVATYIGVRLLHQQGVWGKSAQWPFGLIQL